MQRLHKRNLDGPWYGLVYMYCRLCRLWKYATSQRRNGRNRVWPSLHVLQTLQFMVICNITREIWTDQDKDLPTFLQTLGYSLWKYATSQEKSGRTMVWTCLHFCRLQGTAYGNIKYTIATQIWTDHGQDLSTFIVDYSVYGNTYAKSQRKSGQTMWYGLVYIFL